MKNGMLSDFCDGSLFANHALFKEDPAALQIQLYYDELEVCNPLGSKTKKHKIGISCLCDISHVQILFVHLKGVVYYTLGK